MSHPLITKVATIEIPVSQLERSVEWYTRILPLRVHHKDTTTAMLSFEKPGAPSIFLVETNEVQPLAFQNTNNGVTHSVIDFYTPDLEQCHQYLKDQGVSVGTINKGPNGMGGFGFTDPDGNALSACNVDHDAFL